MHYNRLWPLWTIIFTCLFVYAYITPRNTIYHQLPASHCCKRADLSEARILITGAAGFIGMHLALAIAQSQKASIVGLDTLNGYYSRDLKAARLQILYTHHIPVVIGDVCDQQTVQELFNAHRFSHVAHLAAYAGVRYSEVSPESYERANVKCTLNLLEILRHLPYRPRIVIASSSSVYGNAPVPFREPKTGIARSIYAATKQATESISFIYHQHYGLDITMLRFFTVYGPYGRPDMAIFAFTHKLLTGQPITLRGGGGMLRDFTYVDDIVSGVIGALQANCGGGYHVYNLGNNHPVNASAILVALEKLLDRKAVVRLTKQPLSEVDATWADISAARTNLCWQPQVDLDEGLQRFTDWYSRFNAHHIFSPHVMSQRPGKGAVVLLTSILAGRQEDMLEGRTTPFAAWHKAAAKVLDPESTSITVFHDFPPHVATAFATSSGPRVEPVTATVDYFAKVQGFSPVDYAPFLWLDFLTAHPEVEWAVISDMNVHLLADPFRHPLLGRQLVAVVNGPNASLAVGPDAISRCWANTTRLPIPRLQGQPELQGTPPLVLWGSRPRLLELLTTVTEALLSISNHPCTWQEMPCRMCSGMMLNFALYRDPQAEVVSDGPLVCTTPQVGCVFSRDQ
eukprot:GGOE01014366.1.p1 GENE.GGOE01014366.1~~GGOE01014366.1.p1  ORF type:complete len:627 (-),score=119.57 GGOE01014366.1:276-2156(-)